MAPDTAFYSTTLAQFKAEVKPSIDLREKIRSLQLQTRKAIRQRDEADAHSFERISQVASAVKGDRNHGDDGALYEAMGFTRESKRVQNIRKARRRKRKHP